MQYVTAPLEKNNNSESSTSQRAKALTPNNKIRLADRTNISYTMEFGWGEESNTSPGWNFTGCAMCIRWLMSLHTRGI